MPDALHDESSTSERSREAPGIPTSREDSTGGRPDTGTGRHQRPSRAPADRLARLEEHRPDAPTDHLGTAARYAAERAGVDTL